MKTKWLTVVISGVILLLVVSLASCAPTTGDIQGRLISAETEEPLAGAAIILGLITGESECTLQSDLIASVGEDGTFNLSGAAPGTYIVFYNPSGEAEGIWQDIDGMKITNYELLIGEPLEKPYSGTGSIADFITTDELQNILSDGGAIAYSLNLSVTFDYEPEQIVSSVEGSLAIISEKYGLTMEFHDGEPITVEVKVAETTNVEITVLVTEWPW